MGSVLTITNISQSRVYPNLLQRSPYVGPFTSKGCDEVWEKICQVDVHLLGSCHSASGPFLTWTHGRSSYHHKYPSVPSPSPFLYFYLRGIALRLCIFSPICNPKGQENLLVAPMNQTRVVGLTLPNSSGSMVCAAIMGVPRYHIGTTLS